MHEEPLRCPGEITCTFQIDLQRIQKIGTLTAVVMSDVPPCGVAMGNPARVIGQTGSFEFVNYDGMENDPARKLALQSLATASAARAASAEPSSSVQAKPQAWNA